MTTTSDQDLELIEVDQNLLSRLVSSTDLMTMDFPPVEWAVPGVLPEGYVVLAGPPKVGKSWLALAIAQAVGFGDSALGRIATGTPRPVLVIAIEDNRRRLRRRLAHLGVTQGSDHLSIVTGDSLPPYLVLDTAAAFLRAHANDRPLVVIDTLGRLPKPNLPGQGAYERDYALGALLKGLADIAPGSTVLAVHHTRKASAESDWMESVSGTNGVNGAADATLVLQRARGETRGRLSITGRDIETDGAIALVCDGMRWELDGPDLATAMGRAEEQDVTANLGERSTEVVRYLAKLGGQPASPKDVARDVRMDYELAKRTLARLAEAGQITRKGRGQYVSPVSLVSPFSFEGDTGDTRDTEELGA